MKVLVIGAGAIGSLYGAKLAQAGAQVSIWVRSDAELIKNSGIKIISRTTSGNEETIFHPHQVLNNLSAESINYDYILIATKALPDIDLCALVGDVIQPQTKIILIQNGIHIEEQLANNYPQHEIISIVAFVAVSRIKAGVVYHQDYGKIIIGAYRKNYLSEAVKELGELWQKAGIEVIFTTNILLERWKKLVWNCAFNPLSVIAGKKNTQELLENPLNRDLIIKIMQEICILARADNCELPTDVIEKNLLATEKMKPYKTSMLLDFEANRPMEIEAILGNVVRFAEDKSIPIPYLSTIYAIISNYKKIN